jgi:hypothetical protein
MIFDVKMLGFLSGLMAGIVRSIMGWQESGESFNAKLFLYTMLRTAILGASIGYGLGQEPIAIFFQVYFADSLILNKGLNKAKEKATGGAT